MNKYKGFKGINILIQIKYSYVTAHFFLYHVLVERITELIFCSDSKLIYSFDP